MSTAGPGDGATPTPDDPEPDARDLPPLSDPRRERVRVTSPRASAAAHVRRSVREEIDDETGIGEVYVRSLVRSQLRSALAVTAVLVLGIGGLPLAFARIAGLAETEVGGVPLPWVVLGVLIYPAIWLVGWVYVRQSERAEADFHALVEPLDGS